MDKYRYELWTTVAEVVSAAATVVSLLYVDYEIRQTQVPGRRTIDELLFERGAESRCPAH